MGSMVFSMSALAAPGEDSTVSIVCQDEKDCIEQLESIKLNTMEPISLSQSEVASLFAEKDGIQPYTTVPDDCEPNDTFTTAYPNNQVPEMTPQLTGKNQLFTLGMRHAGLHSAEDEDWYSIKLTAGETYFVDIRNLVQCDWFIEVYYIRSDNTGYCYSSDPSLRPVYSKKTEKYFYFDAQDTGTHYIRVTSGGDWSDQMHYFFYVGPAIQTFDIVDMPTYGGVQMVGSSYRTYTCDLSGMAVPAQTAIVNLSMSDSFSGSTICPEVDKYMSAGGGTYYSKSGSNVISGIANASLGQAWTIGGRCSKSMHATYWSGKLNGRFACIMAPYPGNELSF